MISLIAISIAPVLLILYYLYYRDKYEKEPKKLLFKAFVLGAIIVIPVFLVETWLGNYWDAKYNFPANKMFTAAYTSFVVAASTEEIFKYLAFVLIIWKNKNFNEKFDGIIYAAYISLGFAAIENIMYVFNNGFGVGLLRAFTAIPAHTIFGVTMGYFLALAKFSKHKTNIWLFFSLLAPILLHGFYDFILFSKNKILLIGFIPYLVLMLIYSLKGMKYLSDNSKFRNDNVA